jgi:ketosteroid isomerase-like protein
MPGNDKPMNDAGKYVTIWEKQKDGSLKIKIETWNTDSNPWATNM